MPGTPGPGGLGAAGEERGERPADIVTRALLLRGAPGRLDLLHERVEDGVDGNAVRIQRCGAKLHGRDLLHVLVVSQPEPRPDVRRHDPAIGPGRTQLEGVDAHPEDRTVPIHRRGRHQWGSRFGQRPANPLEIGLRRGFTRRALREDESEQQARRHNI